MRAGIDTSLCENIINYNLTMSFHMPNVDSPLVSIIIPCYNQGLYVREAIDSAVGSTYKNIEIIVVNDGSTDETATILASINHPNVQVYSQDNQGVCAARNMAIKKAQGEYILPLDADDLISSHFVEEAVATFSSHESVGIVYSLVEKFGYEVGAFDVPMYSLQAMLLSNMIVCTALFRKKDWELVGGYDPSMRLGLEDWEFWLSIIGLGREVYRVNKLHFFYRQYPQTVANRNKLTSGRTPERIRCYEYVYDKHRKLYQEHSFYSKQCLLCRAGLNVCRKRYILKRCISLLPFKGLKKKLRASLSRACFCAPHAHDCFL